MLAGTIWRVTADLGDPWTVPKPPALGPKVAETHLVGTKNINREMFTRWLELLSLMWFQVFQWSPQRALRQIPPPAKLLGMDALWAVPGGSWERPSSLQGAPDRHYLG